MTDQSDKTNTYTPYVKEEAPKSIWERMSTGEKILLGTSVLLFLRNRKLKGENAELYKSLKESATLMKQAAVELEALSIFDRLFGPKRNT